MNRRDFVLTTLAAAAHQCFAATDQPAQPHAVENLAHDFARLEKAVGGRLGVAVLDTATGMHASHRANERFPMCSTFKLLAAGAVLARVDAGKEDLERTIAFTAKDLVAYSPVTERHAGGTGMSLAALCEAAVTLSDNTAANLLLAAIGGPASVTAFARSLGDGKTRLDRTEPELNQSVPGDVRDTTTPDSMLSDLRTLVLGSALTASSRERLTQWLLACQTGAERLRAGLPAGWRIGDKTGTGQRGSTNDIGVIWPPQRQPIIVVVYLTDTTAPADHRNRTIADVARAVTASIK